MIDISAFIAQIKSIVHNYLDNVKYTKITYGIVTSTAPIIIRLTEDARIELSDDFLIIPKEFDINTYTTSTNGTYPHNHKVIIDKSLQVNDKVILLRQWGGQKYLVIGRC